MSTLPATDLIVTSFAAVSTVTPVSAFTLTSVVASIVVLVEKIY